jgi:hypothetical protein
MGYPERGSVSLSELAAVRVHLNLPIERDLCFVAETPLSRYAEEARSRGRIVA